MPFEDFFLVAAGFFSALGAGLLSVLELDPDDSDDDGVDDEPLSDSPPDEPEPGFADAYRSLYHPPPLSTKPAALSSFSSLPPHFSHFFMGGSFMDCMYSKTCLHLPWHWYS